MRNYLKRYDEEIPADKLSVDELIAKVTKRRKVSFKTGLTLSLIIILPVLGVFCHSIGTKDYIIENENLINYMPSPVSATASKRDTISIPAGTVNPNPFVPYRSVEPEDTLSDVPKFDLVAPPEMINEGSDAARVMDTIVSGILYDKVSPSAILNIEGNDYLVKKGDIVNNYKVLNIEKNSVTVKLGNNTFKAGIGEILTEGSVNYNDVSNLSKKFGGVKK